MGGVFSFGLALLLGRFDCHSVFSFNSKVFIDFSSSFGLFGR